MFRKLNKKPKTITILGMETLGVAGVWRMFVRPGPHFSANFVDGTTGLLYGLAISLLILGIRLNSRQRASICDRGE